MGQWAGVELQGQPERQELAGAQLQAQAQLARAGPEAPPQQASGSEQPPEEALQLPAWPAPPRPSDPSSAVARTSQ